jgi:hypothetical protein
MDSMSGFGDTPWTNNVKYKNEHKKEFYSKIIQQERMTMDPNILQYMQLSFYTHLF